MQNQKLLSALEGIGLEPKEARVYLAALSTGPTSVLELARAAGLKRTTVYSILDSLEAAGLIRIETSGFKRRYAAQSPKQVEAILERRRSQYNENLPSLMALYHSDGEAAVLRQHRGLNSVKQVYEELIEEIEPGQDYLITADLREWYDLDQSYFEDFIERRKSKRANIRMLATDSPIARKRKSLEHVYHDRVKLLPATTKLTTNLVIIPSKVVVHQLVPPVMAIVIENQSMVQMQREMFEIIWASLPG